MTQWNIMYYIKRVCAKLSHSLLIIYNILSVQTGNSILSRQDKGTVPLGSLDIV